MTTLTPEAEFVEYSKCEQSPAYFIDAYCMVEDKSADVRDWIPFRLWPAQRAVLQAICENDLLSILKARQLGLSWLVLGYALWLILFRPGSQVLMFSRRDDEAQELLQRLKGMHEHLPPFLKAETGADNDHEFELPILGSVAKSFPTTKNSGRSYTATMVIIDEADFILWLKQLITAVKPTIDAGGQLIMISTADKEQPQSEFKRIWRAGRSKLNRYKAVFLPWWARPSRTAEWYAGQKQDYVQDDLWQEYPETPEQALAHRESNMRFRPEWLTAVFDPLPVLEGVGPALPGLVIYKEPRILHNTYLIAVDTSEGDTTSDPSPATVFCIETWEEVAHLYGRFEPTILANYVVRLAQYYANAIICPERNNHGHAFIATAKDLLQVCAAGKRPFLYKNPFNKKIGWLSNTKYKTLAMDNTAQVLREHGVKIRTEATILELGTIEAATEKAIEGEHDDRAMTIVIGLATLKWKMKNGRGGYTVNY